VRYCMTASERRMDENGKRKKGEIQIKTEFNARLSCFKNFLQ